MGLRLTGLDRVWFIDYCRKWVSPAIGLYWGLRGGVFKSVPVQDSDYHHAVVWIWISVYAYIIYFHLLKFMYGIALFEINS